MKVTILNTAEAVAQKAASLIAAEARKSVLERGRFIMAVSGGKTPWMMLRFLSQEEVPWDKIAIFQVDERLAPEGSADRNYTHLQESLLSHAPLQADHIHPMPVNAENPVEAAQAYSTLLEKLAGSPPVFDLVHLGLGADGHTASLIPGDPVLKVNDQDIALTGFYQGHQRMTLTYPIINRSRTLLWVVTGKEKQEALQQLLRKDRSIPGGSLSQQNALLLADEEAAGAAFISSEEKPLKVGIGADHGGFALKQDLINRLRLAGYLVTDFGASTLLPEDDYPDYGIPLGQAVAAGTVDRGIAICGSGVGISVCINKIAGVRAALINDHFSAKQGVEDDHINTLCLGGRTLGNEVAWDLVTTFLNSSYSKEKRHLRRLGKVMLLEKQ